MNCKSCGLIYAIQRTCACSKGERMKGFCMKCIEKLGLDGHEGPKISSKEEIMAEINKEQ